MYYHNSTDTALSFEFSIRNDSACFIGYSHNYKNADPLFKKAILNKDTSVGKQKLYLQADGGVRNIIKFPALKEFIKNGKIIINEAELVIPISETNYGNLIPPDKLALARLAGDGTVYFLSDNTNPTGDDIAFGGYYDSSKKEYRFRIKRYLQQILDGLIEDNGLYLRISGSSVRGNRLVINGTKKDNIANPNSFRLRLTYTKI